jgi:hypothetical protein
LYKTIDFKEKKLEKPENQEKAVNPSYDINLTSAARSRKYDNLKPKLQEKESPERGENESKYQSPYRQSKLKKNVKKIYEFEKKDSNIEISAELFRSLE